MIDFIKKYSIFIVIVCFLVFSYVKFFPALHDPTRSIADAGDGIGTIAAINSFVEQASIQGISSLHTDVGRTYGLGPADVPLIGPSNIFGKFLSVILGHFMQPATAYDFIGFLSMFLISVSALFLFLELGISLPLSSIGALALANMDNFYFRMQGHLMSLGFYFTPLLVLLFSVRSGKNPSLRNLSILAVSLALCLAISEYYGYYASFAFLPVFFGYMLIHRQFQIGRLAKNAILPVILFLGIVIFFYPTVIGGKLLALFGHHPASTGTPAPNFAHDLQSFRYWTMGNIQALFKPFLEPDNAAYQHFFRKKHWEVTFRIGLAVPLFILLASFFKKRLAIPNERWQAIKRQILVWSLVALLAFLFSTSMKFPLALAWLTYRIAPMLRVTIRSLLFFDIALVVIFILLANELFKQSSKKVKAFAAVFTFLALIDIAGGSRLLTSAQTTELPESSLYSSLEKMPEGSVLELPFYGPSIPKASDEGNYRYYYHRVFHHHPIINAWFSLDGKYEFLKTINSPTAAAIEQLKKIGVRYIVANQVESYDFSALNRIKKLKIIATNDKRTIFEVL